MQVTALLWRGLATRRDPSLRARRRRFWPQGSFFHGKTKLARSLNDARRAEWSLHEGQGRAILLPSFLGDDAACDASASVSGGLRMEVIFVFMDDDGAADDVTVFVFIEGDFADA